MEIMLITKLFTTLSDRYCVFLNTCQGSKKKTKSDASSTCFSSPLNILQMHVGRAIKVTKKLNDSIVKDDDKNFLKFLGLGR